MGQLLVRKVDDDLILALKRRAVEHGISAEEEHRRLLAQCLKPKDKAKEKEHGEAALNRVFSFRPLSPEGKYDVEDTDRDFDRHAPRNLQPILTEGEDFKAHLLALGDAGPGLDLERPRTYSNRRDIDL